MRQLISDELSENVSISLKNGIAELNNWSQTEW